MSEACRTKGWAAGRVPKDAAKQVDELFGLKEMADARAALGQARAFFKAHRNPTSHAPKNGDAAVKVLAQARDGFLAAITTQRDLMQAARARAFKITPLG